MSYSSHLLINIAAVVVCWALTPLITTYADPPSNLPLVIARHCSDHCGNISIPYPFGIEEDCYFSDEHYSSFKINCNNSTTPPTPIFGTNYEIVNISVTDAELRSRVEVSYDCYNISGYNNSWTWNTFNLATFTISSTKNTFVAIGCDTYSWFTGFRQNKTYETGCMTKCVEREDVIDGECSGIGCCQAAIPTGVKNISVNVHSYNRHKSVHSFNPCSVSFPIAKDAFIFHKTNLSLTLPELRGSHRNKVPVVFNWAIGTENCSDASKAKDRFLCKENAECYDREDQLGYRCKCKQGFSGNPYLPDGCKVRHRGRGRPKKTSLERNGSRRPEVDPSLYFDNSLSLGGKAKAEGTVLSTRLADPRNKMKLNINCRIEGLSKLLSCFNESKLSWVKDMGMYPLVHLCEVGSLPAQLCYWLATRVNVNKKALYTVDGIRFTLSKIQVHWVLGIPMGAMQVPGKNSSAAIKMEASEIWEQYSSWVGRTRGIYLNTLVNLLQCDEIEELEFKRVFLMFLLGQVLCPTTSYRICRSLLPAVTVAMDASNYDWCSLVLDYLYYAIKNFSKRFYPEGYSAGCGGCMIFLAIFYLDRLKRTPVKWGVWPRIVVWSQSEVNKAQAEDSLHGGDFGTLGCLDVAYLEKHPYDARDSLPHGSGNCHDCVLCGCLPKNSHSRKCSKLRKGSKKRRRIVVEEEDEDGDAHVDDHVAGPLDDQPEVADVADDHVAAPVDDHPEAADVADDHVAGPVDDHPEAADVVEDPGVEEDEELSPCVPPGFDRVVDEVVRDALDGVDLNVCGSLNDGNLSGLKVPCYDWYSNASPNHYASQNAIPKGDVLADVSENCDSYDDATNGCEQTDLGDSFPNVANKVDDKVVDNEPESCLTPPPVRVPPGLDCVAMSVHVSRTRKQRKTKPSIALSDMYVQQWKAPGVGRYQSKLARFVVIGVELLGGVDKPLLKCDDAVATVSDCSSLITADRTRLMSENYVRVAATLFHRMWDDFFVGRSRRIMLDPSFASVVLNTSVGSLSDTSIAYQLGNRLVDLTIDKFNWVFVPVMTRSQWWCAVFSFSNGEVGILDPLDPREAVSNHHEDVLKLKNGVDELVKIVQPSWNLSTFSFGCESIEVNVVDMEMVNSGVEMLIGIKRTACRMDISCRKGRKAGESLLCEHVMSTYNEANNDALKFLKDYMD